MDQTEQNAQQQFIADGTGQMAYTPPPHDTPDVVATRSNSRVPLSSTMQSLPLSVSRPQHHPPLPRSAPKDQLNDQQAQHLEHVQERLRLFWANQMQELTPADFKNHSLPINPIKRIMKADSDVRMIARESPALLAKACEMFILDLTSRAWINTEGDSRRIVQPRDIAKAIYETDTFDFLEGTIPTAKLREQIPKSTNIRQQASSSIEPSIHSFNVPQQHCHGVRASSVTSAGGQELPPFMPLNQPGPQNQQSFMPELQAQSQKNQQQPSVPWPQGQAQQLLQQQTPEQASLFWPQAEQTPDQQNPEQPSPSSPQAELALDQQQDDN